MNYFRITNKALEKISELFLAHKSEFSQDIGVGIIRSNFDNSILFGIFEMKLIDKNDKLYSYNELFFVLNNLETIDFSKNSLDWESKNILKLIPSIKGSSRIFLEPKSVSKES
jgi:hypothetical protein